MNFIFYRESFRSKQGIVTVREGVYLKGTRRDAETRSETKRDGIRYNEDVERIPKVYPPSPCIVDSLARCPVIEKLLYRLFTFYYLRLFMYTCSRMLI